MDCDVCGAVIHAEADWCWRCLAPVRVLVPESEVVPPRPLAALPIGLAVARWTSVALAVGALALSWAWVRTTGWLGVPLALFVLAMVGATAILLREIAKLSEEPTVVLTPSPARLVRVDGPVVERVRARRDRTG